VKASRKWAGAGGAALMLAIAGVMATHFEGTRHTAYQDVGGVFSICQGHTAGVTAGDTATDAQCMDYLRHDMRDAFAEVKRCIHVPLSLGQTVAFTDAAYNLGPRIVCDSTLQRKANAGDLTGACRQLSRWVYAHGRKLRGLIKRRGAEREVCLHGLDAEGAH
jgi:lysozyme